MIPIDRGWGVGGGARFFFDNFGGVRFFLGNFGGARKKMPAYRKILSHASPEKKWKTPKVNQFS